MIIKSSKLSRRLPRGTCLIKSLLLVEVLRIACAFHLFDIFYWSPNLVFCIMKSNNTLSWAFRLHPNCLLPNRPYLLPLPLPQALFHLRWISSHSNMQRPQLLALAGWAAWPISFISVTSPLRCEAFRVDGSYCSLQLSYSLIASVYVDVSLYMGFILLWQTPPYTTFPQLVYVNFNILGISYRSWPPYCQFTVIAALRFPSAFWKWKPHMFLNIWKST